MTNLTLHQHIQVLLDEKGINILHTKVEGGFAFASKKRHYWNGELTKKMGGFPNKKAVMEMEIPFIIAPKTEGVMKYWIALHEIGHIERKHGGKPYLSDPRRYEIEAWDWAFENSIHPLTRVTLNMIYDDFMWGYGWDERVDEWYERAEQWL